MCDCWGEREVHKGLLKRGVGTQVTEDIACGFILERISAQGRFLGRGL